MPRYQTLQEAREVGLLIHQARRRYNFGNGTDILYKEDRRQFTDHIQYLVGENAKSKGKHGLTARECMDFFLDGAFRANRYRVFPPDLEKCWLTDIPPVYPMNR